MVENDKCVFVRYNTMPSGFEVMPTKGRWVWDKNDDLAVAPIDLPDWARYVALPRATSFVTPEIIEEYNIGIGDDVFMVSRFVGQEGRESNRPALRFGNISMMPDEDEPVTFNGEKQEAYLVEMRSIPGCSGSPVFFYVPHHRPSPNMRERRGDAVTPVLLGIDCGHISEPLALYDEHDKEYPKGWHVYSNTGMAAVIPAWRLSKLLDKRKLVMARKEEDNRRA